MVNINKIREISKEKGVKLSWLCEQLGLQRTFLNNVERGKASMSDERLAKIADLLGTTPEYLRDETDEPETAPRFTHSLGVTHIAEELTEQAEWLELFGKLSNEDKKTVLDLMRRLAGE